MRTSIPTNIGTYNNVHWETLNKLSVEDKLALIERLTKSIYITIHSVKPETDSNDVLAECFGAWKSDEAKYSTEQYIEDLDDMIRDKKDFITEFV